jgi:hypothetical protein
MCCMGLRGLVLCGECAGEWSVARMTDGFQVGGGPMQYHVSQMLTG